MLNNKKAVTLAPETLVRILITVALLVLVVYPLGNKVYANTLKPLFSEKKYTDSFEQFVNDINKMELVRDIYQIKLKENTAIIGFSKDAQKYECVNCYNVGANVRTIIFDKPNDEECMKNACICLCSEGFQVSESGPELAAINCQKLSCKKIERHDIVNKIAIQPLAILGSAKVPPKYYDRYWKNGFLYSNNLPNSNGLVSNEEINELVVEKSGNIIGVCSRNILKYNKNILNQDACLITE